MNRLRMVVSESIRSLSSNLSTTVAATMTVLIAMFLLGLFIALFSWVNSWTDHVRKDVLVKVFFQQQPEASQAQINAVNAKIQSFPETKTVVFVSKEQALERMKAKYPELVKNLVDNLKSVPYDKKRDFTVPWQSGAVGLGYNPKKTGRELNSVNDLFDPAFKGRVTMLSEPYDSASTTLLGMGIDPTHATIAQILKAIEKIKQANDAGQFRRFTGNDYSSDLTKGNIWVALAYSGDLVQLQSDNPDLKFVYPDEGAMLFTDNMMIPAKAEHIYAAETMMNYVYEPEVAATLAIYVNYLSPVKGIQQIVEKTEPEIANNPLIFPSDEIRAKLHPYPALSDTDERTMKEAMAKVTGA